MIDLKKIISKFFNESDFGKISSHISFVRSDGIVLYSNEKDQFTASSMGALSSGLWQAASSLVSYVDEHNDSNFRLTFDTTSSGIYILPIEFNNIRFYLVSIFKEALNPAKHKQKLKNLVFILEMYIRDETISVSNNVKNTHNTDTSGYSGKRNEYLFENITDAEIDNLFRFSRV